jgi:hypothetical protein
MGRPKGSKNKPKVPVVAATPEAAPVVQKKRGSAVPAAPAPAPAPEQKKRGGRPKGSKNKPKTDTPAPAPTPAPAAPPTPAPEPPKGKKAAKTIVPTITPEALTKPASPSATQPIEVVRTPTESDAEPVETLTASQLNHPALRQATKNSHALEQRHDFFGVSLDAFGCMLDLRNRSRVRRQFLADLCALLACRDLHLRHLAL